MTEPYDLSPEQWVDKLREGTEFAETPLSRSSAASEPVAWRWRFEDQNYWDLRTTRPKHADCADVICEPLYAAQPQQVSEPGSMRAQWTFDAEARAYYFAPLQASPPPYTTREVTAILDIANDGTLAGVEICEMRSTLPEPPLTSPLPRPK